MSGNAGVGARRAAWCAAVIGLGGAAAAQAGDAVKRAFADAAAAIESLSYGDAIYGRFAGRWPHGGNVPGLLRLEALVARRDPDAALIALLDDADAKVRTLAMLVLFDRGDARHLPRIAALRADTAPTVSAAEPNSIAFLDGKPSGPPWRSEPRTVQWVAQQCLTLYLDTAGVRGDAFDAYWAARKDRTHCASWLAVELLRAHGGGVPVPASCEPAIAAVRKKVLALPTPDRELLLLALPARSRLPEPCPAFASAGERLAAARALGDDALLAILGGALPSDDPDLPAMLAVRGSAFGGLGFRGFVLDHSRPIFAPSSAAKLLALGAKEDALAPGSEADWVAVAASLQPESAGAWIRAAYARVGGPMPTIGKTRLLTAMFDCTSGNAAPWIAEEFWQLEEAVMGAPMRTQVLDRLVALGVGSDGTARARARAQLRAIVAQAGFADSDALTLQSIARAVNCWQETPVVAEEELRMAAHPLGLHALLTKARVAAAQQVYPRETAQLLELMAGWRARITAAVARDPK